MTPVGSGFRSVNVALRKELDLYACLRPCKAYEGVRTRLKSAYTPRGRIQAVIDANLAPLEFNQRTANAWLQRLDAHRGQVMPILRSVYGPSEAPLWWMRWRIFFMACAELFGFRNGAEWWVGHYLFDKR